MSENDRNQSIFCFNVDNEATQSVILKSEKSSKINNFYKIYPLKDFEGFRVGKLIPFKVEFESKAEFFDDQYQLIFDSDVWFLSGDLNGSIKVL